jgi:hypothetical protein
MVDPIIMADRVSFYCMYENFEDIFVFTACAPKLDDSINIRSLQQLCS